MIEWAELIGGFVRWLLKGGKTSLKDEIEETYDLKNYIIGLVSAFLIILLLPSLVRDCIAFRS